MSSRRIAALVVGVLLVVGGLVGFFTLGGVAADVVCAVAVVAGLGVARYGTRPRPSQIV